MNASGLSEEELKEFQEESIDLLTAAEDALLRLESGDSLDSVYDEVFRVLHSLKGAAGMLDLEQLQEHMHKIENHFQTLKGETKTSAEVANYFLQSLDTARALIEGKSAGFDYTFPPTSTKSSAQSPSTNASTSPSTSKPKNTNPPQSNAQSVFVIDDEKEICDMISEILTEAGFIAYSYTNPKQAIAEITEHKPWAIFTDMKMPEATGMDVLKVAQQSDPDIPVIFLSSYLSKDLLIDAVSMGLFAALEKPVNEVQILNTCLSACKRYDTLKLLTRSINLLMYQYSNLIDFLSKEGKEDEKKLIAKEMDSLLEQKRKLKMLQRQKN